MKKFLLGVAVLVVLVIGYKLLTPQKPVEESSEEETAELATKTATTTKSGSTTKSTSSAQATLAGSRNAGFERHGDDITITKAFKNNLMTVQFGQVLKDARIVPSSHGNGMEITRIAEGSIFDKVGLHDGDIIEEVNGTPLSAQNGGGASAMMLMKATTLKVKIKRGDESVMKTITVN